jgi:hypothetical protein
MEFRKYQHIERFGTEEVEGIEIGMCHVFPKIDGTNSSVWLNDGVLCAGSRNRALTLEADNAGFMDWAAHSDLIFGYLQKHPEHRLFGEWLVPHSLKTYRDDAWRNFYVFDVCLDGEGDGLEYIPYHIYQPMLEEFGISYIPPLAIIKNADYEGLLAILQQNGYLVKDGMGIGEGIVIKNYDFYNKYKRQTWAKIVTNEFKEKHFMAMGAPIMEGAKMPEERIVDDYVTAAFVEKEYAKIVTEKEGWRSQYIPMLLGRVFSELVKEEMWNIIKEMKSPTINFKTLNVLITNKIKAVKADLF